MESKAIKLIELAEKIESFRFCSPSDDPDKQDAVVYGIKSLAKRFIGQVRNIQNQDIQNLIGRINTNIENNIYEAYDLHSDLMIVIDTIRELNSENPVTVSTFQTEYIDPYLIDELKNIHNKKYDLTKVIQFCSEINGTFNSGFYISTSLLIRALINHIPPLFGYERFEQVVSQSSKSRKDLFSPLQDIARDVADLHTHDVIRQKEHTPSKRQIEPFKPNVEFLLQEIILEVTKIKNAE